MEWAAPDSSAAPPSPPPGPAPPASPRPAAAPERPRLRPMTVSDVLDGSFAILKAAPGTILAFTAAFAVPVQLLAGWLQRDVLGGESLIDALNRDPSLSGIDRGGAGGSWAQVVLLLGPSLALVFVAAGLVRLVGAWQVGQDLTLGQLLRGSLPLAGPLLASWTLVHVLELAGVVAGGLPGLAVMTWFVVTAPVIGAEGLGPLAALRRSARLTSRRFWPVMGVTLLSGLVATLFGYALGLVPTVVSLLVGTGGLGWVLTAAAGILTGLVTLPIVAGATVLVYIDLRVRTEGLDLELEADEVLPV